MESTTTSSSSVVSAESFIGRYISVTSKMEIRYEGEVVSLDLKDATIALKNVRSFGTEARRKDDPHVLEDNRLYSYIQFRGSDIKDIELLSHPEGYLKPQILNDPAIIESTSNFSGSFPTPISLGSLPPIDPFSIDVSHAFSLPSNTHAAGRAASESTPGVCPEDPTEPFQTCPQSGFFQSSVAPVSLTHQNLLNHPNNTQQENATFPSYSSFHASLPLSEPQFATSNLSDAAEHSTDLSRSVKSNSTDVHCMTDNSYLLPQPMSSSSSYQQEISLSASNQVNPGKNSVSSPHNKLTQSRTTSRLDTKGKSALVPAQSKTVPLLPWPPSLPPPPSVQQPQQSAMLFNEEFDFAAMNEKFNKDEIWGTLGKGKNEDKMAQVTRDSAPHLNFVQERLSDSCVETVKKTSYNKDDFFDTTSSNSRTQFRSKLSFSERMKLDVQTFGSFARNPYGGRRGRHRGTAGRYRGS